MKNIIPKSLNKQKNIVYKFITWSDIGLFLLYCSISVLTFVFVDMNPITKIILIISMFGILLITLIPIENQSRRFYHRIKDFFFYIFGKKTFIKGQGIDNVIPYEKFINDVAVTKKSLGKVSYIRAIKIHGNDITTLDYENQLIKFNELKDILKSIETSFSIIKIDEPLQLKEQTEEILKLIENLEEKYNKNNISKKVYLSSKLQLLEQLRNFNDPEFLLNGITNKKSFYLVIYENSYEKCETKVNYLSEKLHSSNLSNEILDKYDFVNMIKNIFNPLSKNIKNEVIDKNIENVSSIFDFEKIAFKFKNTVINDKLNFNISTIVDYPLTVDDYWISKIALSSNSTMILNFNNINESSIKTLINKAIVNAQTNAMSISKNIERREQINLVNSFENLADQVASGENSLKNTKFYLINYGLNKRSVDLEIKKVEDLLKSENIKLDCLLLRQYSGYANVLPRIYLGDSLRNEREIPISTIANGYPFLTNSLSDKKGILLGNNSTGDSIVFDQFDKSNSGERKNYNLLLMGTSGSGKSFTVKKQLNWHILNNRKVIIIDPEREYKSLCEHYEGNWIDASDGNKTKINPFQIINSIDAELSNENLISSHIQFLEEFFRILFPTITRNELTIISIVIKILYKKFKMYEKDIKNLKPNEFPTFDDFCKVLNSKKEFNYQKLGCLKEDVDSIKNIFNNNFINDGKYAFLYNGYSNLEINKNVIVFDINNLFEKGNKNIIQAQLFLMLGFIQNLVRVNDKSDQDIIIAIDEAHLLIDKDNPIALNFMFQMIKRIRKRNGGIILITQNPDDFLGSEEIRKKTMAMMNNTQYMMILNMSPKNLIDITEMFKSYGDGLSESEKNFIARAKRGQALFMVSGFNRHMITIKHSKNEIDAYSNFKEHNFETDDTFLSYLENRIYEIESTVNINIEKTKQILNSKKIKKEKQKTFQQKLVEENMKFINKIYEE